MNIVLYSFDEFTDKYLKLINQFKLFRIDSVLLCNKNQLKADNVIKNNIFEINNIKFSTDAFFSSLNILITYFYYIFITKEANIKIEKIKYNIVFIKVNQFDDLFENYLTYLKKYNFSQTNTIVVFNIKKETKKIFLSYYNVKKNIKKSFLLTDENEDIVFNKIIILLKK